MAFISKEEMESEADRLGIDLSQYKTWAEKQKAVFKAQADEQANIYSPGPKGKNTNEPDVLKGFVDGKVLISNEIKAMKYQAHKFDEDIGTDMNVEEAHIGIDMLDPNGAGSKSGTYVIKGNSNRRMVAQTSLPTENIKITFDSARDIAPVCEYDGRRGYIWWHPTFFGIQNLLMESGYYEKYKDFFNGTKHPENIWYMGTKFLACSIPFVHYIFQEIEDDAAERMRRNG